MSSINSYSVAAGGICIVNMIVVVYFLYVAVQVFTNFWLTYWIDDGSGVSIRITLARVDNSMKFQYIFKDCTLLVL